MISILFELAGFHSVSILKICLLYIVLPKEQGQRKRCLVHKHFLRITTVKFYHLCMSHFKKNSLCLLVKHFSIIA